MSKLIPMMKKIWNESVKRVRSVNQSHETIRIGRKVELEVKMNFPLSLPNSNLEIFKLLKADES